MLQQHLLLRVLQVPNQNHDDFGTSVSKFLGFEEKDDGFYLDQVITQFNTMGPEKALERANYLKQSGLMNDVSLVDQTLNSLNQGEITGRCI